ncbi:MAG: CPBP family intramembrane glutamic endopeptidase [Nitrososphaerota archaeon]|nr:CPBP family intramembrane metalloprotease [Candidatus Bathyarchaeota archaeon]MDW8023517.1 CPBP family intramembrane glutamic endopeptidase [Nitrososphaerota archaeon]
MKAELKAFTVFTGLIAAAEVTTYFVNPAYGLFAYSFLLVALLALSVFWHESNPASSLFLALSLAPITRIASLSLPLAHLPSYFWYPASGTLMLAAAIAVIRVQGLSSGEVGLTFKKPLAQLGLGLTGMPLGALEYLILRPEPLASGLSPAGYALLALAIAFYTGFVEELVFRGIMQGTAVKALGWKAGLLGVSIIFALLHIGWFSALDLIFVFAVGLIFGYAVLKTGSLVGASLSHGLTNVGLFIVFPFLWKGL